MITKHEVKTALADAGIPRTSASEIVDRIWPREGEEPLTPTQRIWKRRRARWDAHKNRKAQ